MTFIPPTDRSPDAIYNAFAALTRSLTPEGWHWVAGVSSLGTVFLESTVNFDTAPNERNVRFRKDPLNTVQLAGLAAQPTSLPRRIFSLPVGYRPWSNPSVSVSLGFACSGWNGATYVHAAGYIDHVGDIIISEGPVGASTGISLFGVSFPAAG